MRRALTILAIAIGVFTMLATPAVAIDNSDEGNSEVTVVNPALVEGKVWADSHGAYLVATRTRRCWYPQDWYDEVVIVDDLGELVGYNTDSLHYDYVVNKLAANPNLFGPHDLWSPRSCIQDAFVARGDCSTEDRIAVLSSHAIRDAYLGAVNIAGDFDDEDRRGLYCLVVIERDPWLDLVEDESLVPEPVRATFPQFRTLVGLENSVWYDVVAGEEPTNDGFSIGLPTAGIDYNLTLAIWLTEIRVDIDGDGDWDFIRECPGTDPDQLEACAGSAENPVYTFEYENRAFHPFTIETRWGGQAVDADGLVLDIDPELLFNEYTFDWETVEVRSSLDG
jgi:hypothetical protein